MTDTTDTTTAMPSPEKIAKAQETMRLVEAATKHENAARLQPLRDITADPAFATIRQLVGAVPADLLNDESVAPHLMALRIGLNNLAAIAPPPADVPPAAPDQA